MNRRTRRSTCPVKADRKARARKLAREQSLTELEQAIGDREQLAGDRDQARIDHEQIAHDEQRRRQHRARSPTGHDPRRPPSPNRS